MVWDRVPPLRTIRAPLKARDLYAQGEICVKVPVGMVAIVAGVLHELQFPHAWKGDNETIALAMTQINHFIGAFGEKDTLCSLSDCTPTIETKEIYIGCDDCEECNEMAVCGINPNIFDIRDGKLWVKDPCGDWVAIGELNGLSDEPDYTPPPDIDYDQQQIYPCGMATMVASLLVDVAGYIWDESDNTFPLFMPKKTENYIGLDLRDSSVILAANQALIMKGSVAISYGLVDLERSDVIPPTFAQELACLLVNIMGSDGTVDADQLFATLKGYWPVRFPLPTSGNNIFIANYWSYIASAVGSGNLANAALSGQFSELTDCSCPGEDLEQTEPDENGWYLSAAFPTSYANVPYDPNAGDVTADWGWLFEHEIAPHDIYGIVAELQHDSGAVGIVKRANDPLSFMGTYDHFLSASNSDSFGFDLKVAQMNESEFTALGLDVAGYVRLSPIGDDGYVSIAAPPVLKGEIALMAFSVQRVPGEIGAVSMHKFRWLHNINSPSHSL